MAMTENSPSDGPDGPMTWRVTDQIETQQPDARGHFVQGVKVEFITSTGIAGSVFLASANYTLNAVQTAIAAKVAVLGAVAGLHG